MNQRGTDSTPPTRALSVWQLRTMRFCQTCRKCGLEIPQRSIAYSRRIRGTWQYQHSECPT